MQFLIKKICPYAFIFILSFPLFLFAQEYPFQNINLSDDERIDNYISLLTLEEKIDYLAPRMPPVTRLGVSRAAIVEGLHGVAYSGPANWGVKGQGASPNTIFPQAIGLSQMWDPELLQEIAAWEGYETRYLFQNPLYGKKGLIMLAPNADLGRDIRWGRTEECYGEDPYLASILVNAFVKGLQGDHPRYWQTASLMKHFLANSNENERFVNSSDFDERLFREYYSYPFYKGITTAGSRAYMAAYNKYNGIPCTVHPILKEVTVNEWGQNGIICTDGGAFKQLITEHEYYPNLAEAAAACIQSGITMFLDDYVDAVKEALDQNLITEGELDQAIRGNLRVLLKLGYLDKSDENPYSSIGIDDKTDPWTKPEAKALARKATVKSIVLLKNEGLLPIDKSTIKSIAVIGPNADQVISDWYTGTPPYSVSIVEGIKNALGEDVEINFTSSNKADSAVIASAHADVAIVCVGNHPLSHGLGWAKNHVFSDGREAVDRQSISMEQEDLVRLVKQANPNTVMVLVSSFPYAINWSKENVPSILHVTHSSQELGNGVADILFGEESPAGRLVQTWSSSIEHLQPILDYNIRNGKTYLYNTQEPLWPFGHGLSYTTFDYQKVSCSPSIKDGDQLEVKVSVKNTGDWDSDEVVQLYIQYPSSAIDRPLLALKGFARVMIPAGATQEVIITLDAEELKHWDTQQHAFVLEKGEINLLIGASSTDIRLTKVMTVE